MTKTKHGKIHYIESFAFCFVKNFPLAIFFTVIAFLGYVILESINEPLNFIIGAPVTFVGLGLSINYIWTVVVCLFSYEYNKAVCPLCNAGD